MKKAKGTVIVLVVVGLSVVLATVSAIGWHSKYRYHDAEAWNALQEKEPYLPTGESFGDCEDIRFEYRHRRTLFFSSDTYMAIATYSSAQYEEQKEIFQKDYLFETELPRFVGETVTKEPKFSFDGYNFSLLDFEQYPLDYPKEMVFVGFSDQSNKIVFVYFYDFDLDYIEGSFADFLKDECGWK